MRIRIGIIAVGLLAGCSADAIRTQQQAMAVALSSVCATAPVQLMQGEKMPSTWKVVRAGNQWHVWLPPDPGGPDSDKDGWLKGAWIDAKDGNIDHCELRMFGYGPAKTGP